MKMPEASPVSSAIGEVAWRVAAEAAPGDQRHGADGQNCGRLVHPAHGSVYRPWLVLGAASLSPRYLPAGLRPGLATARPQFR